MPAESEFGLFKTLQDYCHATFKEISTHVIQKLLMDIRLAKLDHEHFKKGLDAFNQIVHALRYPLDNAAVAQASSATEALIKEFQEEYKSKMSIFKDKAHIEDHMTEMNRRLILSKHVLANGSEDMRSSIINIWEGAHSQAKSAWNVYKPMEHQIENCYKETKEELQELVTIEERVIQNLSWNYTERDIRQLVDVAWKLRRIHKIGSGWLFDSNDPQGKELGKANSRLQKLMAEMTSLCKQVDDERKAKMDTNIKLLQKDKRSETHVKYEVYVKVDDAHFRTDVCVRNGQQPKFCAAKSRPFEPPVGMRDTGSSKWMPPTLEVQLATTNDPQKIVLKDLKASSSQIHGSFSRKDIIVNLPQKKGPFSRTTIETSGSFGPDTGKHTAKVICTRKGTETCTGYLCKEPSCIHWIDSGIHPS
ncbi:hypothetical protein ACEPAF_7171 [Sanghuangporus sanghuang]